jgi:hypothetical protein
MNRTKLGLFGAARPVANAYDSTNDRHPLTAERQELLAGLTPVERATAEALLRSDSVAA